MTDATAGHEGADQQVLDIREPEVMTAAFAGSSRRVGADLDVAAASCQKLAEGLVIAKDFHHSQMVAPLRGKWQGTAQKLG